MGKRLIIIIPLVVGLGVGMGLAWKDYKDWRYEEVKNYGHGPGELYTPAEEMTERLEIKELGLRVRYPWSWTLKTGAELAPLVKKFAQATTALSWREGIGNGRTMILEFEKQGTGEEVVPKVGLGVGVSELDSTDLVSGELVKVSQVGGKQIGDREYVNSDRGSWTVITYQNKGVETKAAYLKNGEKLVVGQLVYQIGKDKQYLRTWEEWLRNISMF